MGEIVKGENKKEYGILFLFYRYSLLPSPTAEHFELADLENQIFEFQLAVGETGNRHFNLNHLLFLAQQVLQVSATLLLIITLETIQFNL